MSGGESSGKLRWSAVTLPAAPAPMAGLAGRRAMVWGGPPFQASGPSFGSVTPSLLFAPDTEPVPIRLFDPDTVPGPPRSLAPEGPVLPATIVFSSVVPPPAMFMPAASQLEDVPVLALTVQLTSVLVP